MKYRTPPLSLGLRILDCSVCGGRCEHEFTLVRDGSVLVRALACPSVLCTAWPSSLAEVGPTLLDKREQSS